MDKNVQVNRTTAKGSSFTISSILSDDISKRNCPAPSLKRKCGEFKRIAIGVQGVAQLAQPDSHPDSIHNQITVTLENRGLWEVFHDVGTEMVITKSGRRMFPALKFTVNGLDSSLKYNIMMDIVPADNYRYKYHESEWLVTGKAYPDVPRSKRIHVHSESPGNGSKWMSSVISFHKVKITNNSSDCKAGHIVLNSLHKYQPRIHIVQSASLDGITEEDSMTFVFPETSFMAVTAYQSEQITQLKIDNNPFAKGFRDPSPSDLERARLMNAMHYGILGAEFPFAASLPSIHMQPGLCPRTQCVLPLSTPNDTWMIQSQVIPSLPAPPTYGAQMVPKDSPSPKRMKIPMEHRCSPACPCALKQRHPCDQDRDLVLNRSEEFVQMRIPSCSTADCTCSNNCHPVMSHHYENIRRNNVPPSLAPIRRNMMNTGHFDHTRGQTFPSGFFLPGRSSCSCCMGMELRPSQWSNDIGYKNAKPSIF